MNPSTRTRDAGGHRVEASAGRETDQRWSDAASRDPSRWPVGRLLSAAARRVEREWNTHLDTWQLNHASLPVLVMLMRGPHTQAELAVACSVTEQTMSRVLARMERTGYVQRSSHATDRRKHAISITDAGRAVALEAADPVAAEAVATRGLTPEQVEQLRALLTIVARSTPPGA
jgi:MarR family transcriptional regulator, organic hydroperoxide resistance regulator